MKRIKGYTLIETMMAMALTGVVVIIISIGFTSIFKTYFSSDSVNSRVLNDYLLSEILIRDISDFDSLSVSNYELKLFKDSTEVLYSNENDYLIRNQKEFIDTFPGNESRMEIFEDSIIFTIVKGDNERGYCLMISSNVAYSVNKHQVILATELHK